jgi:outer membrane lipoprotein-sorting protein
MVGLHGAGAGTGDAAAGGNVLPGRPTYESSPAAPSNCVHSIEEIAANLRISYERIRGLAMSFRQVNSWADMPESGEVSEGRLWAARGGKLRMEYTDPPGHLFVSDGRVHWVYVPENKQAVVDSSGGEGGATLAEMILRSLDEGEAMLLGEDRVDGKTCCVVLTEEPADQPGLESLKIWVDSEVWLTRALELRDLNENVTRFTFSDVERLEGIDEDIFKFNAPPGVEIVESPLGEGGAN